MIWLDDNGRIVIRTQEQCQNAQRILAYQKALIHLIQNQTDDLFIPEVHWNACELLYNLLPGEEQITHTSFDFKEILK